MSSLARSVKRSARTRPLWALTAEEVETRESDQLDQDADELLNFITSLDADDVIEEIEEKIKEDERATQEAEAEAEAQAEAEADLHRQTNEQEISVEPLPSSLSSDLTDDIVEQPTLAPGSLGFSLAQVVNDLAPLSRPSSSPESSVSTRKNQVKSVRRDETEEVAKRATTTNNETELLAILKTQLPAHKVHSVSSLKALLASASTILPEKPALQEVTLSFITGRQDQLDAQQEAEEENKRIAAQSEYEAKFGGSNQSALLRDQLDPSRLPYLRRCPAV